MAMSQSAFAGFLLAVARTAGFVLVAPPFASRGVPARAKAAIAIGLALPLSVWTAPVAPPLDSPELLGLVLLQVFAGVAFGFVIYLAVTAIQSVGDLVDLVGGFNMAVALDPLSGVQTSIMGRLHQLLAITLLVATDLHLTVLQGFTRSMQLMPLPSLSLADLAEALSQQVSGLFVAAVQVAGPVIAVMFVADIILGLLTRAAPALNAFALGFPLKILLTMVLVGLLVPVLPGVLGQRIEEAALTVVRMAGG
jgi:flagellar biosynthetic protein FliR